MFIKTASQWDKDVIAGCQYYYESRSVGVDTKDKGEENTMDEGDEDNIEDENSFENQSIYNCVSEKRFSFFKIYVNTNEINSLILQMRTLFNMKRLKDRIRSIFMVN